MVLRKSFHLKEIINVSVTHWHIHIVNKLWWTSLTRDFGRLDQWETGIECGTDFMMRVRASDSDDARIPIQQDRLREPLEDLASVRFDATNTDTYAIQWNIGDIWHPAIPDRHRTVLLGTHLLTPSGFEGQRELSKSCEDTDMLSGRRHFETVNNDLVRCVDMPRQQWTNTNNDGQMWWDR